MKEGPLLYVDEVGRRVKEALERLGWSVQVETHNFRDYMRLWAIRDKGLLKPFTCM